MSRLLHLLYAFSARHPLLWLLSLVGVIAAWALARPADVSNNDGAPLTCTVAFVLDGDTMELLCDGRKQRVRLHCIDAPEMEQVPWGRASRDHLRSIAPRRVVVIPKPAKYGYKDRFGRLVGEVLSSEGDRRNLNISQLFSGNAAVYPRFCPDDRYYSTEEVARSAKSGIWARTGLQQTPWRTRR